MAQQEPCEWSDECEHSATMARYDHDTGEWLPVCDEHQKGALEGDVEDLDD